MSIMQNDPDEKQKKFAEQMERKIRRRSIKNHAFAYWIELLTEILEIAVAIIVLIGFIISVIPLVKDMPGLLDNSNNYTFHVFLEHAFNLVIGIEFIRMLIKHTPGSALDVLLFAIARHMVLDVTNGLELLMGVASIAGIFAIRKYLYVHSFESEDDTSIFAFLRKNSGDQENKEVYHKEDNHKEDNHKEDNHKEDNHKEDNHKEDNHNTEDE